MPSGDAELMLIRTIGERMEYLVARVDDLHDTVCSGFANMRTKAECEDCKSKWVPKSWAAPLAVAGGIVVTAAGFAGDLLKVAGWFGIQR